MNEQQIKEEAKKYANKSQFKSDFPHDWNSVYDGFIQEMKLVLNLPCVVGQSEELPLDNDKAWNTHDVIAKLVEAADILLHKKDYDGHGWEEIEICYKRGKELLQQIKQ